MGRDSQGVRFTRPRILVEAARHAAQMMRARRKKVRRVSDILSEEADLDACRRSGVGHYNVRKHIEALGEYLVAVEKEKTSCT